MKFRLVSLEDLTQFFLSEPKVTALGLSDVELCYLYKHKKFQSSIGSYFVEMYDKKEGSVGILRWELFTNTAISVHMYLRSKFQKKQYLKEIFEFVCKYLKKRQQIKSMISFAPKNCRYACMAVKRLGFKFSGEIPNGINWRNQTQNLMIFSVNIEEFK